MSDLSTASSRPQPSASSLLSSPAIHSLSIKDISDEDREQAAKAKAKANKAFTSMVSTRKPYKGLWSY